ncbi:hypothetical protein EMCRGX_G001497 [Ephydatia muelleri]
MIVTEDTPTDEQQTNWIKDESLGNKGVEMWGVWGGGVGGERSIFHQSEKDVLVERLLQELQESRRAGKDVSSNSDSLTSTNKSVTWPWIHDLNHRLQLVLTRALAPSTTIIYATGVRCYQGFCHAFKLIPVPGTKETITLFAAHLSQSMNPRIIQVYVAAVPFLHHSLGYKSPASRNPMLRLGIRGLHASTGLFTSGLRSANLLHSFDPRIDTTSRDISWSGEGIHFFFKRSRTDHMGKHTTICIGCTKGREMCPVAAMEATENAVAVPHTQHPSTTSEMGGHSHPRASAPPSYPWWINAAMVQTNTTPTVYVLVQPQQLPEWAFPLTPFRSSEDGEAKLTRNITIIP